MTGRRPQGGAAIGTFTWPIRISSMDGERSLEIEATVDTGAAYTTLPTSMLKSIGEGEWERVVQAVARLPPRRRGVANAV